MQKIATLTGHTYRVLYLAVSDILLPLVVHPVLVVFLTSLLFLGNYIAAIT